MNKKYKIICPLLSDEGRDVEILLPIVYFAERYLNCSVEFVFVWEAHLIFRKKPDLIIVAANTVGDRLLFQISKHAAKCGIKVFSFISEGNFRTNGSFDYWGYNYDKIFFQDFICHWSKRTQSFLIKELPELKHKMVVTGAPGFDRYKIYQFLSKDNFLEKKKLTHFSKIITYAGWAFGKLFNKQGLDELNFFFQNDPKALLWVEDQMRKVEGILRKVIENNQDILFILKRHPSEINPSIEYLKHNNEMVRLKDYPNVMYITNEIAIHDLINISDLWLGFETTTVLEAWLLKNITTILINPDVKYFQKFRDELYKGSIIVSNYQSLQDYITEFYSKDIIKEFFTEEKIFNRKKLITETIGYDDGLNHVRSGFYLMKTLDMVRSANIKVKFSFNFLIKYLLLHIGKYFYNRELFLMLPKFRKTVFIFERYKLKNLIPVKKTYDSFLNDFHEKHNIRDKIHSDEFWSNLIES